MLATVGHNSAAFGQTMGELTGMLGAEKKTHQDKIKKGRFPYFKFYPRDWLEATRCLSLEERGAYIDLICILMEMEGHLRDDDKWIAHQMHVSPRKWKAVKGHLVTHEKIQIEGGLINNERCAKELASLLDQRRNISGSALTRERTKRETSVKSRRTNVQNDEKVNENNDTSTTMVPLRARASDSDLEKEKEKEEKKDNPPPPVQEAVVVGEVDGLNGATSLIIGKLAGWINPMMPDKRTARSSIENFVSLYTGDVVRDAFGELEAKMLHGDIVARPIPYLASACQRIRDRRREPKRPKTEAQEWHEKQDRARAYFRSEEFLKNE